MKLKKLFLVLILSTFFANAQEGLPVYQDYLSDNIFLLHPSMAGIGSCSKVRLTARQQWSGVDDSPMLQTLSVHTPISDRAGAGLTLINDRNGYHSQKGVQAAFAYHLDFSRSAATLSKLSFGLRLSYIQSQLDETSFDPLDFDPIIAGVIQSKSYINADFGVSYHYWDFYAHATVKNALLTYRDLYTRENESPNLRNYVFTLGYDFGFDSDFQVEPSITAQIKEHTAEKVADFNIKFTKKFDDTRLWMVASYRRSFDQGALQDNSYITPIVGLNYKQMMFSYTYTHQLDDVVFKDGGFHQITVGFNFACKPERYHCDCPYVNF